jgi:SAM-dependent methyltransferase
MTCPVCGRWEPRTPGTPPWALLRGASYRRCLGCFYIYLERSLLPPPEEEKARYLLHRNDPEDPGYRSYLEDFIRKAVIPFVQPGARILDFGSGPVPALAGLLSDRGYPVSVYDPYFAPDRTARTGPFDLIVLHEVAEHLSRPYFEIARLARTLAPGGRLAIRTRFAPEDPEKFRTWWYREDPTHVGFFGSRPFAALAGRLGMSVELDDGRELAVLRTLGDGPR